MNWRLLLMVPALALSAACSWVGGERETAPTLAELQPALLPAEDMALPEPSVAELIEHYNAALEILDEPETLRQVKRRVASLEMIQSEQQQVDGEEAGPYYRGAVDLYTELLEKHPDHSGNDRLLYQLAKAYELDGRQEPAMERLNQLVQQYPSSALYPEAQFRRAEILFSGGNYREAERAYKAVIDSHSGAERDGAAQVFYRNALYMHGWSQFKSNRYRAALHSLAQVLDGLLPDSGDLQQLSRSQQNIAEDSLRVMSLAFSYLDGAKTIDELYSKLGERPYQYLFYQRLGDLYLAKERYRDSADTYRAFVEKYPGYDQAPLVAVKIIDVYGKGDFPSLVLAAKRSFIQNYGIYSDYWGSKTEVERDILRPYLHSYLTELAKYQHALAQSQQRDWQQAKTAKARAALAGDRKISAATVTSSFLAAGKLYREFIATFPDHDAIPGILFLMAESLNEGGDLERAIDAYEQVAYHYPDTGKGAEAGYSAILAYDRYIAGLTAEQQPRWQYRKIERSRRFAGHYADDKRAAPVLAKAAEQLLDLKDYPTAITVAAQITTWQPAPGDALRRTAWLVQGHSQFELQDFVKAEQAYRGALALMAGKSQRQSREQTTERLAASVFKRSEQLLAAGDKAGAVAQLLRIQDISPDSEIAIKAQYDSAAYLMELAQWPRAEKLLVRFRQRYARHALAATIPAKLAQVYQQLQDWQPAAGALLSMSQGASDPQVKRESLYLAAEMYEKAENWPAAIEHYRDYAHGYPEPFDVVTEARYKMSQLYVTTNAPQKRRFWLRKLIDGHRLAGEKATDRSNYLAPFSASVLADDQFQRFRKIALKLPLKKSLKKKRAAMERALAAYNQVLEYGVQEFSTQSSFRLGDIYARLSYDLMNSERPRLKELELEQYDILLEEQAYPFEETAIEIHQGNAQRSWQGIYDQWVKKSFAALAELLPARYDKLEQTVEVSRDVY